MNCDTLSRNILSPVNQINDNDLIMINLKSKNAESGRPIFRARGSC
jgi:succinyl-CoA synthetase beta subunit